MQARQQTAHELALPRPLVQPQANRALHHLGMVIATLHLVDAAHDLVGIARIEVLTHGVRHANLELAQREHRPVHGLVGVGIVRAGTGPGVTQLVCGLGGGEHVRGGIGVLVGDVEGIVLVQGLDDGGGVVGTVHGIEPLALTGPSPLFVSGVVLSGVGGVGLLAGDVATGASLLGVAGGVIVGRFHDGGAGGRLVDAFLGGKGGDALAARVMDSAHGLDRDFGSFGKFRHREI
mmetsp:Transcript_76/g.170  ORF Transcript_76/g.170 Transcript_76/m.170 type:complete len:234 (-) Transcript_76:439-1140(-)